MTVITLRDVRLAFPDLWKASAFEEGQEPKFGATLLIPKNSPQIKEINAAILEAATTQWKGKAKAVLDGIQNNANKFCFGDGDDDSKAKYDGYQGHRYISAKNPRRPTVVDRDRSPLTEADGRPYAGCYVNAKVEIWAQDNKWGKGIRATLLGVQFTKDGDAFSAARVASAEEFDDLSEGAEDDLA